MIYEFFDALVAGGMVKIFQDRVSNLIIIHK